VEFTCVTSFFKETQGETEPFVYVTGTDKSIREIKGHKKGDGLIEEGIVRTVFEQSVNLSQITLMHNRRAFFTCVEEKDRPGSIQIIRGDMREKIFEIQAHSLAV
jgi:hypothetical protein